jgi:hypothetical protein
VLAPAEPICGFFSPLVFFANGDSKMARSKKQKVDLPCLTITESSKDIALLRERLNQEIKPKGYIEQMLVDDVIALSLEFARLRRWSAAILNAAGLPALQGLLAQLLCAEDYEFPYEKDRGAEQLARTWFDDDEDAKTEVAELLAKFGLDESAIEAEAYRLRADDLDRLNVTLTRLEVQRENLLRLFADYRKDLAILIDQSTDKILENDEIPVMVARIARPD